MNVRCTCTETHGVLVGSKAIAAGMYPVGTRATILDVMVEHHENKSYEVSPVAA